MTALALLFVAFAAGERFVPVTDTHGVKVFRRLDVREIELVAEATLEAPPERVRAVLLDYEHHGWVHNVAEARILARGDGFLDVYERLDLPVLDDRDYTLHVTWGSSAGFLWMKFSTANERGPAPRKGVVRVAVHDGSWELRPIRNGAATEARYWVKLDLAGSLPAWIARRRAAEDVPSMFEGIRHQL